MKDRNVDFWMGFWYGLNCGLIGAAAILTILGLVFA